MHISKILSATMLSLVAFSLNASIATKELQILINPADPTFQYSLNIGGSIVHNFLAVRPAGSYYYLNGLILPGGTISKKQSTFTVDKHGNPITAADSLGFWECIGNVLVDEDLSSLPSEGTLAETIRWDYYFNEDCHDYPNVMTSFGKAVVGVVEPAVPAFLISAAMIGTRCNKNPNHYTAKIYISSDSLLIKLTFQDNVRYDK